jgi:myo-inositol-1-phosphate synthase
MKFLDGGVKEKQKNLTNSNRHAMKFQKTKMEEFRIILKETMTENILEFLKAFKHLT